MENLTFKLDYAAFNSAMTCVSNDDTRYYLNGVHIFIRNNKFIYEATDGHILIQIESKIKPTIKELDIIVPKGLHDDLKMFIRDNKITKLCKSNVNSPFFITVDGDGDYISVYSNITPNLLTQRKLIVDCQFPQTTRVIPNLDNSRGVNRYALNVRLLSQLVKGFDIYFAVKHYVAPLQLPDYDRGPALIKYKNFIGVIMPVTFNQYT